MKPANICPTSPASKKWAARKVDWRVEEGLREGVIIARQKAVLDALEIRFGEAPESLRQTVEATQDEARLRSLYRIAIQAASLEAFARELEG